VSVDVFVGLQELSIKILKYSDKKYFVYYIVLGYYLRNFHGRTEEIMKYLI